MDYLKEARKILGFGIPLISQPFFIARVVWYLSKGHNIKDAIVTAFDDIFKIW